MNVEKNLDLFVQLSKELILDEEKNPVVRPIPIENLFEEIDIKLNEDGISDEEFIPILRKLIFNTPRTATKMFFNQLFGGRNGRSMLGELLSVVLNNSMYTYKVGGPQIGVEKEIISKISSFIGLNPETSEGTLAPGGSMTNLMGLIMARDQKDPDAKWEGVSKKMTVYTSEESHYSLPKNMAFAGLGRNYIRTIEADDYGRMSVEALEAAIVQDIKDGFTPCMVNATAGTTVLAAFDPLKEIGYLCKKYDIWFHVDGAYCGSVLFSEKYKHHIDGCEMADSFTLNAHKMLATPLACSIIVTPHKDCLYESFSNKASYLYQTAEDDYNPGKISMQCGRRNDTLKFWTLWKSIGTKGIGQIVDHEFELAQYGRDYVADNPNYTLYNSGDSIAICFNYKGIDPKVICNSLYEHGEIMVGYGKFREQEFIRLVTVNSGNQKEDLDRFFNRMESFVEEHLLVQ
ncbi:MAG: pyridoxal-dependent decarboxylase [Saprospiraceae bacterium]|nr:pyridoxal-dependent decarboxylase [Saprospiraceae bacterium]